MDSRAQAIFRQLKANPDDPELREQAEALVKRWHIDPAARFQADLALGGRLERALKWEMEFSRMSCQVLPNGGMVSCGTLFGALSTHIRIWYPTFEDLMVDFLPDDVRIVVTSNRHFSEVVESLEDNLRGATIVSANVARVQREAREWGSLPKPKRGDLIDREALTMDESDAVLARGGVAPGHSSWVA